LASVIVRNAGPQVAAEQAAGGESLPDPTEPVGAIELPMLITTAAGTQQPQAGQRVNRQSVIRDMTAGLSLVRVC
jgi:hypothetical protein